MLPHTAQRGNVETELAGDDTAAGCGYNYPEWVSDAEVERSNVILARLRAVARRTPDLRAPGCTSDVQIGNVGGLRVAIVHGDAESLAGWEFSQEALRDAAGRARAAAWFEGVVARVFASSHTCLAVMQTLATTRGRVVLANNGAAGMPSFRGTRYGLLTRIARTPAPDALYGTVLDGVHIQAPPVSYEHDASSALSSPTGPLAAPPTSRTIVASPPGRRTIFRTSNAFDRSGRSDRDRGVYRFHCLCRAPNLKRRHESSPSLAMESHSREEWIRSIPSPICPPLATDASLAKHLADKLLADA